MILRISRFWKRGIWKLILFLKRVSCIWAIWFESEIMPINIAFLNTMYRKKICYLLFSLKQPSLHRYYLDRFKKILRNWCAVKGVHFPILPNRPNTVFSVICIIIIFNTGFCSVSWRTEVPSGGEQLNYKTTGNSILYRTRRHSVLKKNKLPLCVQAVASNFPVKHVSTPFDVLFFWILQLWCIMRPGRWRTKISSMGVYFEIEHRTTTSMQSPHGSFLES